MLNDQAQVWTPSPSEVAELELSSAWPENPFPVSSVISMYAIAPVALRR
jgi:hypothetical protein